MNVIGFWRSSAGLIEAFARVIPAADVHHGHAALIMLIGGAGILLVRRLHALLGDFEVHASAVGEFFAGAFENFFELLLGTGKFLLVKECQRLVIELELSLDAGVNQFDAAALGGRRRR